MPERHVVTTLGDLPLNSGKAFMIAGRRIALFNAGGKIFAIDDACPHDGAPLSEGSLDGTTVICPWHSAEFDVACGRVLCPPAVEDVGTYRVTLNGEPVALEF